MWSSVLVAVFDVKKTGLQLHLCSLEIFHITFSGKFEWEHENIINLDKVNVYHDISIYDFIMI